MQPWSGPLVPAGVRWVCRSQSRIPSPAEFWAAWPRRGSGWLELPVMGEPGDTFQGGPGLLYLLQDPVLCFPAWAWGRWDCVRPPASPAGHSQGQSWSEPQAPMDSRLAAQPCGLAFPRQAIHPPDCRPCGLPAPAPDAEMSAALQLSI